jgi:hypothetical protein
MKLAERLQKAYEDMSKSNKERDDYRLEYEIEKARMTFSGEVSGLSNQAMRDAQLNLLLEEKGMYRKMAELETKSREDYYWWKTLLALFEGGER